MEDKGTWVEQLYTHFLGRDLSYLFGGGLFIFVAEYSLFNISYIPEKVFEFIAFLLGSYFLGLGISEVSRVVIKKRIRTREEELVIYEKIVGNYNSRTIDRHERTVFLMHVGASLGASASLSAIMMFIGGVLRYINDTGTLNTHYILVTLGLTVYGIYMAFFYTKEKRNRAKEEQDILVKALDNSANENKEK